MQKKKKKKTDSKSKCGEPDRYVSGPGANHRVSIPFGSLLEIVAVSINAPLTRKDRDRVEVSLWSAHDSGSAAPTDNIA